MQAEIYQIKTINYLRLNNLDTGSILIIRTKAEDKIQQR